jgi:hypothetical protein
MVAVLQSSEIVPGRYFRHNGSGKNHIVAFEFKSSANDRVGGFDGLCRFFPHCEALALPAVSAANGFEFEVVSQKQDKGTRHSGGLFGYLGY